MRELCVVMPPLMMRKDATNQPKVGRRFDEYLSKFKNKIIKMAINSVVKIEIMVNLKFIF